MAEQVYKNLHKDEEGYFFATDTDTLYLATQEGYLLSYILEILLKMNMREEVEAFLSNERKKEE